MCSPGSHFDRKGVLVVVRQGVEWRGREWSPGSGEAGGGVARQEVESW